MKAVRTFVRGRELGEEFRARVDRDLRFVIEGDAPARIPEHQRVVMRDVHEVHERLAAGAHTEERVTAGVARAGDDVDRAAEEGIAMLHELEVGLEHVELVAGILDHAGERALGAFRPGEVGYGRPPEVDLLLEAVHCGVRKDPCVPRDESADVVDMRMAEECVCDRVRRDADGRERFAHPSAVGILPRAEAAVEDRDLVALPDDENIDVERQHIRAFAMGEQVVLHRGAITLRPHEGESFAQRHVAIADRPGLDVADGEAVDERIAWWRGRRSGGVTRFCAVQ